jgi:uncharacterized protein (TIGR02284 family)
MEAAMSNIEALKSLHTTLIDAQKGYDTALKDAEDPKTRAIFETMSALHANAHADVHAVLLAEGERPNDSGSFLSLVHQTVISVRSAVKGLDATALPSFIEGEERIVGAYDKAMEATASSDPALETLHKDRQILVAAIADMKAEAA